jgi:predicted dehydrogenase
MTPPPYRVAILGCGQVSADHLVGWSRCKGATVVAACDPLRERAEGRARQFGFEAAYDDPVRMLEQERPDLVDVITPRETHADMVKLAASHGVRGILCEKPLCPTLSEAQDLVRHMAGSARLMVNENWRYRDYYRKIGQWISEGRLGAMVHYRQSMWRANMLPDAEGKVPALVRQPFMAKERRLLVAESLIHNLDVARSLLGDLDVIAARLANASNDIIGEDTAVIFMENAAGISATVEAVLTAAGHHIRAGDRLEIAGTRCSVILDNAVVRLIGAETEEHRYDETEQRQACFDASIQHFVDRMTDGAPFWTSAEDQLGTLKIVEDAYALAGPVRRRLG